MQNSKTLCLWVSMYLPQKENNSYPLNGWNIGDKKITEIHALERGQFVQKLSNDILKYYGEKV